MRLLWSILLISIIAQASITDFKTIQSATDAYRAGDFNKSKKLFSKLDRDGASLYYNKANSDYKSGDIDSAIKEYKRSKGDGIDEHNRLHNLGNAYFKKKNYDYAIKAYEKSLKLAEDKDTRYNLELLKKMKKKQKQKKKRKLKNSNNKSEAGTGGTEKKHFFVFIMGICYRD